MVVIDACSRRDRFDDLLDHEALMNVSLTESGALDLHERPMKIALQRP